MPKYPKKYVPIRTQRATFDFCGVFWVKMALGGKKWENVANL